MARVLRMPGVAANATEAVLAEWLVEESVDFAAADARYYASPERQSLDPDPSRHLTSVETRLLRPVEPTESRN